MKLNAHLWIRPHVWIMMGAINTDQTDGTCEQENICSAELQIRKSKRFNEVSNQKQSLKSRIKFYRHPSTIWVLTSPPCGEYDLNIKEEWVNKMKRMNAIKKEVQVKQILV